MGVNCMFLQLNSAKVNLSFATCFNLWQGEKIYPKCNGTYNDTDDQK